MQNVKILFAQSIRADAVKMFKALIELSTYKHIESVTTIWYSVFWTWDKTREKKRSHITNLGEDRQQTIKWAWHF